MSDLDPVVARQQRERAAYADSMRGSDIMTRKRRLRRYLAGATGAYIYTQCTPSGDLAAILKARGETL